MRDKKAQNAKSKTEAGEFRPKGTSPSGAEQSLMPHQLFSLERNKTMATAKYKITMEVEFKHEAYHTPSDKDAAVFTAAAAETQGIKVNKIEATKIGATGVEPKVTKPFSNRACRRKLHKD